MGESGMCVNQALIGSRTQIWFWTFVSMMRLICSNAVRRLSTALRKLRAYGGSVVLGAVREIHDVAIVLENNPREIKVRRRRGNYCRMGRLTDNHQ